MCMIFLTLSPVINPPRYHTIIGEVSRHNFGSQQRSNLQVFQGHPVAGVSVLDDYEVLVLHPTSPDKEMTVEYVQSQYV